MILRPGPRPPSSCWPRAHPPFPAYREIINGAVGSLTSFSNVLVAWVPLLLAAAGLLVTFAAGCGTSGWKADRLRGRAHHLGAAAAAGHGALPRRHHRLAILAGMVGGALWAALAGVLKTFGGVNEIFGGLGLNFVATALTLWLIFGPWKRPGVGSMSGTEPFPEPLCAATIAGTAPEPLVARPGHPGGHRRLHPAASAPISVSRSRPSGQQPRPPSCSGVPTWQYRLLAFALVRGARRAGRRPPGHRRLPPADPLHLQRLRLPGPAGRHAHPVPGRLGGPVALFFAALNIGSIQLPIVLKLDSTLAGVLQGALVLFVILVEGGAPALPAPRASASRTGEEQLRWTRPHRSCSAWPACWRRRRPCVFAVHRRDLHRAGRA